MVSRSRRIATTKSPCRNSIKLSFQDIYEAISSYREQVSKEHHPGIYYYSHQREPKWRVLITHKKRKIHLGMFSSLEEAKERLRIFREQNR